MNVHACTLGPAVARGIALICAAVVVASAASTAHAAGVVGTGSAASCTDSALNAALAGGGLVTFDCGADPATIDISAGSGTKTIAADTTVNGGGLITISGGNTVRVFRVLDAVDFTVENVTIADGYSFPTDGEPSAGGGGILNGTGLLTVINSTFAGNAAHDGGGISSNGVRSGSLTVTDCTFTNNSATGIGGAILNNGNPTLTVTNSTFAGNSAENGGGIANIPSCTGCGMLTITNSSFTGNGLSFGGFGGAAVASYYFEGPLAPALLRNTIVANSPTGENCFADITDGGHNLDDGTSCGFSAAHGSLSDANAQLDPAGLQVNGGPTETVALCTAPGMPAGCTGASPAIDAGDQAVCAMAPVDNRDQRGFVRPGTGHTACSIGAYEADGTAPQACTGDCDDNGVVAINELILGVDIALGTMPVSACEAFDCDGTQRVAIDCLVRGVNNSLDGCPTAPTPTPTALPCDSAVFPTCDGPCPTGQVCASHCDFGCFCRCIPSCLLSEAPACGGDCPSGEVCGQVPGQPSCMCVALDNTCDISQAPTCGGTCPSGFVCGQLSGQNSCTCVALDNTCDISQAPTCGGTCPELSCCPSGQVCAQTSAGDSCACVCSSLPCPFVITWGSGGTGDGQFSSPVGVAADGSGHLFVADRANDRIQKFTTIGTFLTKWGSLGIGDGQFGGPSGVAVDGNGNVFVADTNNDRIQKFTNAGTFLTKWGSTGSGDGQFKHPQEVAVDGSGHVFVADGGSGGNHRVQKFTTTGTFLTQWGSAGTGDGQFGDSGPSGVAVDGDGNVFVADLNNHRVQKFTTTGTFLTKWGGEGTGDGQFSGPIGVAVDGSGNVFVADFFGHDIQKFDNTGTFLTRWGCLGSGDGQFSGPYGLAVDGGANVFVADANNNSIQKFACP